MGFHAVIFDLGGVVLPSPLDTFRAYEARRGLPHRFLSEVVVRGGDDGAWSRLERGELAPGAFADAFEAECAAAGGRVSASELLAEIGAGGARPRPRMVAAIRSVRAHGLRTAALTNSWPADDGRPGATATLGDLFDVVVESTVVGLRKPDPRIYELTCGRLGVEPAASVFLDDLGVNLKSARALGMTTIKVGDPDEALRELEVVLGLPVGG